MINSWISLQFVSKLMRPGQQRQVVGSVRMQFEDNNPVFSTPQNLASSQSKQKPMLFRECELLTPIEYFDESPRLVNCARPQMKDIIFEVSGIEQDSNTIRSTNSCMSTLSALEYSAFMALGEAELAAE